MDSIDQSEVLNPNAAAEILLRAEARGAVSVHYTPDGRVQSAAPPATVLEYMTAKGREWLSAEEESACRLYVACKEAFEARTGASTSRLGAARGTTPDGPGMADTYSRALRNASRGDCKAALDVYYTAYHADIRDLIYREKELIAEALGRLGRAMRASTPNDSDKSCV